MLPIHKELVERMFTSGLLKLLFTTETFALGINMPARSVVFASLRKFDGVNFDYMQTRDYMQMAGRAGRQGIDTDGLVFSMLSPKDLAEAPLKRLFLGRPEPVESRFRLSFSSILHLVEKLGRARVHEAWEKSFNQFQHRVGTKKQQEYNRREQRRLIDAHIGIEGSTTRRRALTPRGKVVAHQWVRAAADGLPSADISRICRSRAHGRHRRTRLPGRRRGEAWVPTRLHGNVRTSVQREYTRRDAAAITSCRKRSVPTGA
jgi:replicative superfamily II helicase